jgi:hypothetical protein
VYVIGLGKDSFKAGKQGGGRQTRWWQANKMVACKQDGGMQKRWWHANKMVACKQDGGMQTRELVSWCVCIAKLSQVGAARPQPVKVMS